MFRANEAAIRLLMQAQARAEEAYLASDPPPLEWAADRRTANRRTADRRTADRRAEPRPSADQ